MDQTPNLKLPYIMPSQAQKHVTHNEAIRALDALVQMAVKDRDLDAAPALPAEGDRYLVAAGALGAWAGKDGLIAAWQDGAWAYFTPAKGWLVWVADESRLVCHDGAGFVDAAVHSVNPVPLVGVNAAADATNRLSVKSPASLFDAESGDHRMKINKADAGATASLLFQSGYSGRAEFGLTGDDAWTVKVSADGATWIDALNVEPATGRVRLPAGLPLGDPDQAVASRHVREKLSANRTYYVRTDGSDANTGLADSSGAAFLTIQKAWNTIVTLDLAGYAATIKVADGTYAGGLNATVAPVGGLVTLAGNTTTPANCVIATTGAHCVSVTYGGFLSVGGFKLQTTTSGNCINVDNGGSRVDFSNVEFGACAGRHINAGNFTVVNATSNYSITGSAVRHLSISQSFFGCTGKTVTLTGTLAFSQFILADRQAFCSVFSNIYNIAAATVTGQRYNVQSNGIVGTGGGGASYFPGDAAGAVTTQGQYT